MQLKSCMKEGGMMAVGQFEWVEAIGVAEVPWQPCESGYDRSLPSRLIVPCSALQLFLAVNRPNRHH